MAAAPRRNLLTGAADWQREEKLNQQRDYAAQLQEQVRLKQAAAEQAKAQKLHEQRLEREMVDRERAANTKQRHQQPAQPNQTPPALQPQPINQHHHSPGKSPARAASFPSAEPEMRHATAVLGGSPTRQQWLMSHPPLGLQSVGGALPPLQFSSANLSNDPHHLSRTGTTHSFAPSHASGGGTSPQKLHHTPAAAQPATYSFSNTPSIFEALLHECEHAAATRSGSKFYETLDMLQRLTADVDRMRKERQQAAQHAYVKPNFMLQLETQSPSKAAVAAPASPMRASSGSPLKGGSGSFGSPLRTQLMRSISAFELEPQYEDESSNGRGDRDDHEELELGLSPLWINSNQCLEIDGLSGESVLIPLTKARSDVSPTRRDRSPVRASASPLRSPALRHDSELLAFASSSNTAQ